MSRAFPRSMPPAADEKQDTGSTDGDRSEWPLDADDFAAYYRFAPAALAVRECLRLRAVRRHDLDEPILDIGCGDGIFARLAHPNKHIWGIDVNPTEIRRAQATAAYNTLVCGSITNVDLPRGFFKGAIANCSLEHVAPIDDALANICRALAPGARFILIVPTPEWTRLLAIPDALRKVGLPTVAEAYGKGLDNVFHHVHLYDSARWSRLLEKAGFEVRSVETLTSRRSSVMFDLLMYPSLAGWVTKKITGKWVISPMLRSLTADVARGFIDRIASQIADGDDGSEYLIVCEVPRTT